MDQAVRAALRHLRRAGVGAAVVAAPAVWAAASSTVWMEAPSTAAASPPSGAPIPGLTAAPFLDASGVRVPSSATCLISRATYPANDPIEDRHDVCDVALPLPGRGARGVEGAAPPPPVVATLAAVLDGHGGWQAAEFGRRSLLDTVARELHHCGDASDAGAVGGALARAFTRTDRAFLSSIRPAFTSGFGELAHVGACATAAVILPAAVVAANAGDCRVVLGRMATGKAPSGAALAAAAAAAGAAVVPADTPIFTPVAGEWRASMASRGLYYSAVSLTRDHNAREPWERARLAAEHPGEADIVVCKQNNPTACYVKGRLQPTRALGDGYLKDSEFNVVEAAGRAWGRRIPPPYTPPYVSR
jgi:pyruvate dehydrogenase phosphatase